MRVQSLGQEDLEEGMAAHSSILVWKIPWTEKPGGLPSMALQRVGHDWSDLSQQSIAQYFGTELPLSSSWGIGITPGHSRNTVAPVLRFWHLEED